MFYNKKKPILKIDVLFFLSFKTTIILFFTFYLGQKTSQSGACGDAKRPTGKRLGHEASRGHNLGTHGTHTVGFGT
jgi:hypothetical protein